MTIPVDGTGGISPLPPGLASPLPPGGVAAPRPGTKADRAGSGFAEQLRRSGGVQFSKHALERVRQRGIPTDPATVRRLERGIELAAGKNSRDAVVMVDNTAFVVSVRNRTVITAVDSAHMRKHVFTNIDSAVVT